MNINKEIDEAYNGFEVWNNLTEKFEIDNDTCVVCLPTPNKILNDAAIQQLEDYAKAKFFKHIILVTLNEVTLFNTENDPSVCIEQIHLNHDEMKCFIRFVRLVNVSDKVIVISDDMPFGNLNLVGKHGICIDDYVAGTYLWRTNASDSGK